MSMPNCQNGKKSSRIDEINQQIKYFKFMPPKKDIIIILILFFIVVIAFAILYINKQPAIAPSDGLNVNQAGQTGRGN